MLETLLVTRETAEQADGEPRVHLWTREEYYQMGEIGLFQGRHVELIEGQVIDMSPMGSRHEVAVGLVGEALQQAFGVGFVVRLQMSLIAEDRSEPEPDVAVIPGRWRDFTDEKPQTALLIVEVADTSLKYDRTEKNALYAELGIPDYWVLNLVDRQLEVFRQPQPDPTAKFGFRYAPAIIVKAGESIETLEPKRVLIHVDDLLP